ncbi:cullin-9-like [Patagioenas fasciata monilis]|uniref:Large ribosomal subunit protein uL2m n=1 Tax=Patagioenas fasciata monilis TaxID=372326 RepID=A0A1V4KCQ2_PATFA|nr:cullin-9-like [Patagioenas fasciata monilis]
MKKTGGRDHTGRIRVRGIGGGHKRRYRMIDFQRLRYEDGAPQESFSEKVINVRYDPCRSADIALVAGGNRKRWIIATENMQPGDIIKNSSHIGRMAVSANEGDAYRLGALPVGTLICNLESHPGKGAQYIRAAGTCGVLLRKVNGTAIVQLPSKRHMQVLDTCVATVGRVSNVNHNKRVIGKAGRNRWLGKRPHTALWEAQVLEPRGAFPAMVNERHNGNLLVHLGPKLQAYPQELLRQRRGHDGQPEYLIRWSIVSLEERAVGGNGASCAETKPENISMWMSAEEVCATCPTLLSKRKLEGQWVKEEKAASPFTADVPLDEASLLEMKADVRSLVQRARRQMSKNGAPESFILNTIHILSAYASIGSLASAFKETGALDLLMKMLCHKEKQIRHSAGNMLRALASHDAGGAC